MDRRIASAKVPNFGSQWKVVSIDKLKYTVTHEKQSGIIQGRGQRIWVKIAPGLVVGEIPDIRENLKW